MLNAPFSLQQRLIAYGHDKRAIDVPASFAALDRASIDCILGINDFSDDDSVHANHWECHPDGDETLCVLEGRLLVVLELEHDIREVVIEKGQAFIVPRARWHRLQVLEPGRLLFFSPAVATELRPRA